MDKILSLNGYIILILVLSFTGCGKSETTEYDQATLEQYAEFVVQNFEAMTTEQLDSFSDMRDLQLDTQLMNAGLPVDGEDFLTMISSWEAAEEECGAYVEHGDWTMEVKNDGVSLTSEAKYENRDGNPYTELILDIVEQDKQISTWQLENIFVVEFEAEYGAYSRI